MRTIAPIRASIFPGLVVALFPLRTGLAQGRTVAPVLSFPEAGLDDPSAYQGYQTRFFRDAKGNVVQVYLDARSGRVVNLLADAVDESAGFTVRDGAGKPVALSWSSSGASVSGGATPTANRSIEYRLVAAAPQINIGWLLLGSMRVERDLQYSGRHLEAFGSPTFVRPELNQLVENIGRLPAAEQSRELALLNARTTAELSARISPAVEPIMSRGAMTGIVASQTSFDGRSHLQLELVVDPSVVSAALAQPVFTLRARSGNSIPFTVRVTTDGPALTPLSRNEIFNGAFLRFLETARARATSGNAQATAYYRQLERDVRGTELLSSREKLMAGLPNYATYFGRDMMMTSLMMEPVWQDAMFEHVIASALRKLGPEGDVSHEEALGGQAIRENASEYNAHITSYFRLANAAGADTALAAARALLSDMQRVRENYHMRDDEFQLPIIVSRYLRNPGVTAQEKQAFLLDSSDGKGPRLGALLRELSLVADLAAPYARDPRVQNLIASPRLDSTHWRSISWRDSNAGYANGRFAMDINAIWAPRALRSIAEIFSALRGLGFGSQELAHMAPGLGETALASMLHDRAFFQQAIRNWNGVIQHFVVSLSADQLQSRVAAKLASLPPAEGDYWRAVLARTQADKQPFEFVALSLDESGTPIPVVNTDPATWLFLHDAVDSTTADSRARALRDVRAIVRNYPVGLFIDRLGPVVANDAFASPSVWAAFEADRYHSPRVVWGREVNLIMLGLGKQIASATDGRGNPRNASLAPFVAEMRDALTRVNAAVEASGLKHNELWSYEIRNGSLFPIRYGASTDVQLWNVTDLAVQYTLSVARR